MEPADPAPRFGALRKLPATGGPGWRHEAHDFTPWLAEHLDLLGEELGLTLELHAREHTVGRYSLDLLLGDAQERVVIVENQFGQTDHDHLGKLLTYCAGVGADVVIWIAEVFTDEHLAALEWLNETTVEGVGFFAVELELLRIDDSLPAPHFRVLAQPNDWTKRVRPAKGASVDWDWAAYAEQLRISDERLAVGRALVAAIEQAIEARCLPWQTRFRKGYVAFQRPGGYNVALVDLYWYRAPRFAVKVPARLEELGVANPYPALDGSWIEGEREWGWTVRSEEAVPDVGLALDAVRRYHPASGPMTS